MTEWRSPDILFDCIYSEKKEEEEPGSLQGQQEQSKQKLSEFKGQLKGMTMEYKITF